MQSEPLELLCLQLASSKRRRINATPVESAPVESAPVESAPVESAPVEPAPVEPAPVEPREQALNLFDALIADVDNTADAAPVEGHHITAPDATSNANHDSAVLEGSPSAAPERSPNEAPCTSADDDCHVEPVIVPELLPLEQARVDKIKTNCKLGGLGKCRCQQGPCKINGAPAVYEKIFYHGSSFVIAPLGSTKSSMVKFRCLVCADEHDCKVGMTAVWNHCQSQTHFMAWSNYGRPKARWVYQTMQDCHEGWCKWLSSCNLYKQNTALKMARSRGPTPPPIQHSSSNCSQPEPNTSTPVFSTSQSFHPTTQPATAAPNQSQTTAGSAELMTAVQDLRGLISGIQNPRQHRA